MNLLAATCRTRLHLQTLALAGLCAAMVFWSGGGALVAHLSVAHSEAHAGELSATDAHATPTTHEHDRHDQPPADHERANDDCPLCHLLSSAHRAGVMDGSARLCDASVWYASPSATPPSLPVSQISLPGPRAPPTV